MRYALFIGDGNEIDSLAQVVVDDFIATTSQGNDTLVLSLHLFHMVPPPGIHTLVQVGDDILHPWVQSKNLQYLLKMNIN